MTLKEQIAECKAQAEKIIENNPLITNVWFEIYDVPMDELREAQGENNKMYFSETFKRMVLQNPYLQFASGITVFARSKEVKVKEHIVIEDAIVNV